MVLAFAFAPAVCMASAISSGVFTRFLVHAHDHDEPGHAHHGHPDHYGHNHGGSSYHHHDDDGGDEPGNPGQHRLHVHFDICCPSVLIPVVSAPGVELRLLDRLGVVPVRPIEGAPRDRLLRPPIS
jgi:hypothetical protein